MASAPPNAAQAAAQQYVQSMDQNTSDNILNTQAPMKMAADDLDAWAQAVSDMKGAARSISSKG
jgi:hypothetical protein